MSVETTRLHGIIDRLRAISEELYDMGYMALWHWDECEDAPLGGSA